jgi:hypothetical protein
MKEDFLHYLWKFKKFNFLSAKTCGGETIELQAVGMHNTSSSGPDFFNARLKIGEQVWAGNVEIHINSSDWYAHKHETDPAFDNVILHVVWEHDVEIFRKDNSAIPCLELKKLTPDYAWKNYKNLLAVNKKWINCATDFNSFSEFKLENWLERLYVERLEKKSILIQDLLNRSKNDWEAVLFQLLAKNFGLNKNGEVFLKMAQSLPFSKIRQSDSSHQLEALFFGQLNMLDKNSEIYFEKELIQEYKFLKSKYNLKPILLKPQFFRLRPTNFPTIRLSQLAQLYASSKNLFSEVIKEWERDRFYAIFSTEATEFWKSHYTFEKESKAKPKILTKKFVDLILINTVIPLKFAFDRNQGKADVDKLFGLMRELPGEKNRITNGFEELRKGVADNAMASQALIQLKPNYCDKNRCLECNLGLELLNKKSVT